MKPVQETIEIYPENYSKERPYHVEITIREDKKSIRLFRAQYHENSVDKRWNPTGEVHPWNLDVYHDLVQDPKIITFWKEDFIKWVVDAMNDRYELIDKVL